MKISSFCIALMLCVSMKAQTVEPSTIPSGSSPIPSTFFGASSTTVTDANQCPLDVQYPEKTITLVDPNFSASPVGFLGHEVDHGLWAWAEPNQGQYDWSFLDQQLKAAHDQGAAMILVISRLPGWAADKQKSGGCSNDRNGTCNGSLTVCTYPPRSYVGPNSDWGLFIQSLMDHLNRTGYLGTVMAIELWNEANSHHFWGPARDSDFGLPILVALAQTAYPIIHKYSACYPNCPLVLTPSAAGATSGPWLSGGDGIISDWIFKYLTTQSNQGGGTGKDFADGITFHGYLHGMAGERAWPEYFWCNDPGICGPQICGVGNICRADPSYRKCPANTTCYGPIDTLVESVRTAADKAGAKALPIFDTEGSWGRSDLDVGSEGNVPVPLDTAWMARWYLLQAGEYSRSNLRVASWFDWDANCLPSNCLKRGSGTLGYLKAHDPELVPLGTPGKSSAYGSGLGLGWLTKWLVGSTFLSRCSATAKNPKVWSCSLRLEHGDPAQIVWYPPSGSYALRVNSKYGFYQDLTGCMKKATNRLVTISQQPLILLVKDEGWGSNRCR
jgi:hypothetical protein